MTQHIEEARKVWGYFKGGSAGGTEAMQWFDNNKSCGGPAYLIEVFRAAIAAAEERGRSEERERCAYEQTYAQIILHLNPEDAPDDHILRDIHLRLQTWGESDAGRMVSVFHRNIVLWAVCKSIEAAISGTLEAER